MQLVAEPRLKGRPANSKATAHFVTAKSGVRFLLKDPSENYKQVRTNINFFILKSASLFSEVSWIM